MATAALRELILSGELSEGESLRQRELADRLGVSQTPVREALQQLQSQGLVTGELIGGREWQSRTRVHGWRTSRSERPSRDWQHL